MHNKVITRIKGGLGNQLFCYAAARRLALVNNAELVIDDVSGFVRDVTYRRSYALDRFKMPARKATPRERMKPFERYRRGLAKFMARRQPFYRRRYIERQGMDFDRRLLHLQVKGTVYLDGVWQSEGYFKDVEERIRADLRIIPPDDAVNLEMAERILGCNAVAVHVRWFERPESRNAEHNLNKSYYTRAVKEIIARTRDPYFFLFSNDPDAAQQILDMPDDKITCVSHNRGDENSYADLWLMSKCKHFIIANSTFSWWGAWLSKHDEKLVVAPGDQIDGITKWGFAGLLPESWSRLSKMNA